MKKYGLFLSAMILSILAHAQNYTFDFNTSGRRVCLVSTQVSLNAPSVKLIFHDSTQNSTEALAVNKRPLGTQTWSNVAPALAAGTGHWIDTNVSAGEIWEYQVKRQNTWIYKSLTYDAVGYTIGALLPDNTIYKGQMILLVADDIPINLTTKYVRLKKEIMQDGWFVNELIVPKATSWDSGNEVVTIKNQIASIYNNTPQADKPKVIFILGRVPLPRCGSTNIISPDDHIENTGARGCDAYYADIDGVFTDTATYNPGGLSTNLAINLPNDYKWDQEFIPSGLEMAFGRIDFGDITEVSLPELTMIENYLDRLSNYRNVASGSNMGEKTGFYFGYDNSNDASYRNLFNISKPNNVYQNYTGAIHNQWVNSNGPFKIYMQNIVIPTVGQWDLFGMDATVYSSDQSYWGFGDVPQPNASFSRIRALLAVDTKCLITLWTTSGINIFHQSCTGRALGVAMKEIMDHNPVNQYLEKPEQEYDEEEWWNRTHFAFYGDPTINLYQIAPASNLLISASGGNAILDWSPSPDTGVIGYHIYKSPTEFGMYERITTSPINANTFTITNYQNGDWYMVKAIKFIESGCGQFIHASMGISGGTINIGLEELSHSDDLVIYPNPNKGQVYIQADEVLSSVKIMNASGSVILEYNTEQKEYLVDLKGFSNGIYFIEAINLAEDYHYHSKIIKSD